MIRYVLPMLWISVAQAQPPAGQNIADAATFGAVATLAPLCGLRDENWSADLRRAATQTATDTARAAAALGYGDMEALEDFAADKPDATCSALRTNPALGKADAAVDTFRRRRDGKPVG
jgi:hypothetical protein